MPGTPHASDHVVTRFAPSPTGHLHIGGARSALLCWAFARNQSGRFMIRIEDTDQARSSEESARGILDDLAWLGITWDDGPAFGDIAKDARPVGPYFQAQRIDIYNQYLEALVKAGRAYPAFETSEQLDGDRKAAAAKKATYKYPRPVDAVLGQFNEPRWQRALRGEPHVLRFVMPPHGIKVDDQVLGEVKFAAGEVDDFVIRKQDGFPTYHFAVVVDDELMGVTHVMRAQEHLINTPRHVALQQALVRLDNGKQFRTPVYAHMPLIFNTDGSKMSKRDKAKAARKAMKDAMTKDPAITIDRVAADTGIDATLLAGFADADNDNLDIATLVAAHFKVNLPEIEVWDFRKNGYLPGAITNFLALLGWSTGRKSADGKDVEKFDMDFLAKHFSIDRIGKTSAKFDRVKLLSFNGDYIAQMPDETFYNELITWAREWEPAFAEQLRALPKDRMDALVKMARTRCKTLRDATKVMSFALIEDEAMEFDPAAMSKALAGNGREVLDDFKAFIADGATDAPAVDAWVKRYAESKSLKMGDVAQPIRVGVTGSTVSPPLGDVVSVLGRDSTLRRIERCLSGHHASGCH
ncbi:MAG: glutamate--tRNA ligase [Phycisphaerales bacterium]|nr:glutamate--tRNA ligase [Phycisphaerales bacterium]